MNEKKHKIKKKKKIYPNLLYAVMLSFSCQCTQQKERTITITNEWIWMESEIKRTKKKPN